MYFVGFASALDSMDRGSLWRITATDAYKTSTKMKVRVSGGDSTPFESRSVKLPSLITISTGFFAKPYKMGRGFSEISLRTKGRVYQAVVGSNLLYGREIWPRMFYRSLTMTASAAFYT